MAISGFPVLGELTLFAAGLGGFIELILLLIVAGVWVIRKLVGDQDGRVQPRQVPPPAPRAQAAPRPATTFRPMDPMEVDTFLGEMGGGERGMVAPPVAAAEPVVLRPGPAPQRPRRPPQPPRRPARGERERRGEPSKTPSAALSNATQAAKRAVEQAAAAADQAGTAAQHAASLVHTEPMTARASQVSDVGDVRTLLRSPVDLRRAILIQEILGPPLALRRRHFAPPR